MNLSENFDTASRIWFILERKKSGEGNHRLWLPRLHRRPFGGIHGSFVREEHHVKEEDVGSSSGFGGVHAGSQWLRCRNWKQCRCRGRKEAFIPAHRAEIAGPARGSGKPGRHGHLREPDGSQHGDPEAGTAGRQVRHQHGRQDLEDRLAGRLDLPGRHPGHRKLLRRCLEQDRHRLQRLAGQRLLRNLRRLQGPEPDRRFQAEDRQALGREGHRREQPSRSPSPRRMPTSRNS